MFRRKELAKLCRKLVASSPLYGEFFITQTYPDGDQGWFLRDGGSRIYLYCYRGNGDTNLRLFWIDKNGDGYGADSDYSAAACQQVLVSMRRHMILEVLSDL